MKITKCLLLACWLCLLSSSAFAEPGFNFGVSLPLSGDFKEYGQAVQNGFALAQSENSAFNSKIAFTYEDNKFLSREALTNYQVLANVKKVDLMYVWGEVPTSAIQHIVDKGTVPVLAMSVDGSPFHNQRNLKRIIADATDFMKPVCAVLKQKDQHHLTILQTEDPFTLAMARALSKCDGIEVVSNETVGPNEKDFKPYATKLHAKNPQLIGVLLNSAQAGVFAKDLKHLGSHALLVGTDVMDSATEIALSEGGLEGALFPAISVPAEFEKRYKEHFGNNDQVPYAYNAYLTYTQIVKAYRENSSDFVTPVTGRQIVATMEQLAKQDQSKKELSSTDSLIPTTLELKEVRGTESHWVR